MPEINETRKLVQFDLTAEDIPSLAGFDWETEVPYAASMAEENLRVVAKQHPGKFQEVLLLACRMMARANPDKWIEITGREYDDDGTMCGCTVAAIPPDGIEDNGPDNLIWYGGNDEEAIMEGYSGGCVEVQADYS